MAIVTIAFGASLATAMLNLSLDVGDKMARELRQFGANIAVEPDVETFVAETEGVDFNPLAKRAYIDESQLPRIKMIFWKNNIVGFTPYLYAQGESKGRRFPIIGSWYRKKLVIETGETVYTGMRKTKPWVKVDGAWIDDQNDKNVVLVGAELARDLRIKKGQRIKLPVGDEDVHLSVKGVLEGGGSEDKAMFLPLALVQEKLNQTGKVQKLEVSALTTPENALAKKYQADPNSLSAREWDQWYCTAYVDSIAYQIEEAIPGVKAKPVRQVAQSEGIIISRIQLLMLALTIAALVSSALGISSLMGAIVLERQKEIGLAKAIGADNWAVILLFLTESAVLGLIGGTLGYGVGFGFSQLIGMSTFGIFISLKPLVPPIILLIAIGIAIVGSISAVSTLIRLSPKEVLHGN